MPDPSPESPRQEEATAREAATRCLRSAVAGDEAAMNQLFQLVYDELRALAASHLRSERVGHTLQPTALVHEVFTRLVDVTQFEVQGRSQFLALASRAMRRVLVDHARGLARMKRGGRNRRIDLEDAANVTEANLHDLVEIDQALLALAKKSERQAKIVELRFFGGLDVEVVAETLGISVSTVEREWRVARAWLAFTLKDTRA